MNRITVVGIILGACILFVDRYIVKVPNWLAIVLYIVAVFLIVVGMIVTR